jgi:hypothetical protein
MQISSYFATLRTSLKWREARPPSAAKPLFQCQFALGLDLLAQTCSKSAYQNWEDYFAMIKGTFITVISFFCSVPLP